MCRHCVEWRQKLTVLGHPADYRTSTECVVCNRTKLLPSTQGINLDWLTNRNSPIAGQSECDAREGMFRLGMTSQADVSSSGMSTSMCHVTSTLHKHVACTTTMYRHRSAVQHSIRVQNHGRAHHILMKHELCSGASLPAVWL